MDLEISNKTVHNESFAPLYNHMPDVKAAILAISASDGVEIKPSIHYEHRFGAKRNTNHIFSITLRNNATSHIALAIPKDKLGNENTWILCDNQWDISDHRNKNIISDEMIEFGGHQFRRIKLWHPSDRTWPIITNEFSLQPGVSSIFIRKKMGY